MSHLKSQPVSNESARSPTATCRARRRSQLSRVIASFSRRQQMASLFAICVAVGGTTLLFADQPHGQVDPSSSIDPSTSVNDVKLHTESAPSDEFVYSNNTAWKPQTPFRTSTFTQSIKESLHQRQSADPFSESTGHHQSASSQVAIRQVANTLPAPAQPAPAQPALPTTVLDRDRFDDSVGRTLDFLQQVIPKQPPGPLPSTPSITTTFVPSGFAATTLDRAQFDDSIGNSLDFLQRAIAARDNAQRQNSPAFPTKVPFATSLLGSGPGFATQRHQTSLAAGRLNEEISSPSDLLGDDLLATDPLNSIETIPSPAGQLDPTVQEASTTAPLSNRPGSISSQIGTSVRQPQIQLGIANGLGSRPVTATPDNSGDFSTLPSYHREDFSATPVDAASTYHDGQREAFVYDDKRDVPTQRPLVEWGRDWFSDGITPHGINLWGDKNLVRPKLYVYGDYRAGILAGRNAAGRTDNVAHRLNLDVDFQITDTERFHAFVGPWDNNGQFTRFQMINGDVQFREEINFTPVTGFFEGDLGVIMGAAQGRTSPFELPVTIGLIPLLFQNGIWMEDAVTGAAFALPARHSRLLNISNMDWTFFAGVDQLNSPAFVGDSAAQVFGTAMFIEAYGGYIETGYAYLNDRNNDALDYHNATFSFTKRYFDRISNSVRVIVNAGQDGAKQNRTADGALLLVENSWITASPLTFVPYANFFAGWDRPQSVARAGGSGDILRNSGINFASDALNGFATLDATGSDSAGCAVGVDLIGDDLNKQLIVEAAYQTPHGSANANLPDDQFAIGSRFQVNLSHRTLLRFDAMHGWRRGLDDVYGTRMEYRWKF